MTEMAKPIDIPVWGLWMMFVASALGTYLLGRQLGVIPGVRK